jgi:MerR family transcriptional regulator, light-induced transcriptional regulator
VLEVSASTATHLSIGAVERDTGLSKDVLRVWERRYGFPTPDRDASGERLYPIVQVERLRLIKRLTDAGHRPGRLLVLDEGTLTDLSGRAARDSGQTADVLQGQIFEHLRRPDPERMLRAELTRLILKQGLRAFVADSATRLNRQVADAVIQGDLSFFQQRVYRETLESLLRDCVDGATSISSRPNVLLTSLAGESDAIGLLMIRALLAPEDVPAISLGTEVCVAEIAAAAALYNVDAIVMPFAAGHSTKNAFNALQALRKELKPNVAIWATGELARRVRLAVDGVVLAPTLNDVLALARQWRSASGRVAVSKCVA